MRIIGGELKGRKFAIPASFPVRPTTDFAREALFNILMSRFSFEGLRVLDLFTGTGSIALECWSRGARDISAVDRHPGCCAFLNRLAVQLGAEEIAVYRSDALGFIKADRKKTWDFIFADPPYNSVEYQDLASAVTSPEILALGGLAVIEHGGRKDSKEWPGFEEDRRYGGVYFTFLRTLV